MRARFVGRTRELEALEARVRQLQTEGRGQFVVLTGEPGVGKSRLAEEFEAQLHRTSEPHTGPRLLAASTSGIGAPAYAAIQRLLCTRFAIDELEGPAIARDKVLEVTRSLMAGSRAVEVSHLLAQFIGLPFPESPVVEPLSETPAQLEARTFLALKRFLAADAQVRPLVLLLDDIHRASPETVNLVHYLAAGLASAPVLLVVIGRPSLFDRHPSFGQGDTPVERIELDALSSQESDDLVRALLAPVGEAPVALLEHARSRLHGVPRTLVEFVRLLVERQIIVEEQSTTTGDQTWRLDASKLAAMPLPGSIEAILASRLAAMAPEERALLERAATCGDVFWMDALLALERSTRVIDRGPVSALDDPSVEHILAPGDPVRQRVQSTLDSLRERGLLMEHHHSAVPGEREYQFAYPPWRKVIYDGIDQELRRRYHRLVAQWMELRPSGRGEEAQEEIGRHLERSGDGDGAAMRYRRAADVARANFYNDKAIRLFERALACLSASEISTRIQLWHDLGSVHQLKGQNEPALKAYEQMLRLAWVMTSRSKAAVAMNKMGRLHRQRGELSKALPTLERSLEFFEQSGDQRGIAGTLDDIGQVLWMLARYDEALDRSAAALEARRRLGDKRSIATSLLNIGHIERHRGLFDAAHACYAEALELRTLIGDKAGIAQVRNGLGVLAFQRGDIVGARGEWELALELAERIGALPLQATVLSHLGEAARSQGQRFEARTRFEAAEALAREIDDKRLLSEALRNLGLIDLEEGNRDRALDRCRKAHALAEEAGIRVDVGRALIALGEVHASTLFDDTGSGAEIAEGFFRKGVALFREIGNEAEMALGLERFGKYQIERGQGAGGRDLLQQAQEILKRLGMTQEALQRLLGDLV
jgi:tetratricopeptide (TPR) repeat protein